MNDLAKEVIDAFCIGSCEEMRINDIKFRIGADKFAIIENEYKIRKAREAREAQEEQQSKEI